MSSNADSITPTEAVKDVISGVVRGARARWWRRRGSKRRGFWYETADGQRLTDESQLERIKSLVIPPAWSEVRISPSAHSSLQAIGLDASKRVQRIYHPSFAARQQRRKYEKIERFGEYLASLRRRTNEDIARDGLTRERVLAVVVRLINDLYFRVGSEESVKRYKTFGVTTLRNNHLEIKRGGRLVFSFVGKHHIHHRRIIVDDELAALVRDIKALGGKHVFQYIGEDGKARPITPRDVNEYIKSATTPEFSAKDFRTWGGTLLAAAELAEIGAAEDDKAAKRNLVKAVTRVAERLGNTPTVCRSCYVHPLVLENYLQGVTLQEFRLRRERRISRQQPEYEKEELALMEMFRARGKTPNAAL
ncbi:MAG: DNA topoisomerase IB [Acidobacteriota bacterium]|nr:DNA topoisomerase IB [Acidobacteriota bacterium]